MSDEAYCIGPAPSSHSYLNIEAILTAAKQAGAEAIHPGYGFLAENAAFPREVNRHGLTFIGPGAEAMEVMGSKTSARRAALEAGVPVVPGTTNALKSLDEAREVAAKIGYPVMLKHGRRRGAKMRQVAPKTNYAGVRSGAVEAASAFGD